MKNDEQEFILIYENMIGNKIVLRKEFRGSEEQDHSLDCTTEESHR